MKTGWAFLAVATAVLHVCTCGSARAAEAPSKSVPEIVRTLSGKDDQKAITTGIDVINASNAGKLVERDRLVKAVIAAYVRGEFPTRRRPFILKLLSYIGGRDAARLVSRELSASGEVALAAAKAAGALLQRHRAEDGTFRPAAEAGAMENLAEALVDLAEDGSDEARGAAVKALGEAKVKLAAPALIEMLREEPALASAINDSLKEISGRDLPPDPDAWESWRYYDTTHPEERETDKERSERLALPAEEDGRMELPPATLARLKGSWKYVLAAACGVAIAVVLVLARSRQTRRWTAEIEAGRRKVRRRSL